MASSAKKLVLGLVLAIAASLTVSITIDTEPAAAATCQITSPDGAFSADVENSARYAQVWRLYQAYFLRQPDRDGLEYWMDVAASGASLQAISTEFALSREFSLTYGQLDNRAFLTLIYSNVLCRNPDGDGFDYWLGLLDSRQINRGEMLVLFSESAEYGLATDTRWLFYANPYEATLAEDGYQLETIPGGQIVRADYSRVDFNASQERCSIASINGNWFHNPESSNPTPIGFAVVEGQQLPGAVIREDRGVLGERYRPNGPVDELYWVYQGTTNLSSNLEQKGDRVLESWNGWQPAASPPRDNPSDWRWAAAGTPLLINGQLRTDFNSIPTNNYTFYTRRHSFVAFDKDSGTLAFGSTTNMNAAEIIDWARAGGYDDLIKFDGGGSVEFNVGGGVQVAGTGRDVPLWLGLGC